MKDHQTFGQGGPVNLQAQRVINPSHRILVVDDDSAICQLNAEVLTDSGYEVDIAVDGEAAWQALNTDTYDLMITDNSMPKLTGVDLLRKLRTARMALPVIMATGTVPTHEFAQSPWLKPDATLLKPFTTAQLLEKVSAVLGIYAANTGHTESPLPRLTESPMPDQAAATGPGRIAFR